MAFKNYQVNFDENGDIESVQLLPDDPTPKKRTIVVREETERKAQRAAEALYSLAQ